MSTIEDKILDGPRVNYCDAENDDMRSGDDLDENHRSSENDASSLFSRPNDENERLNRVSQVNFRSGSSSNTGPKGVIEDYRKHSDPRPHGSRNNENDALEAEFQELLNDDSILKDYIAKRMSEAMSASKPTFGNLHHLRSGAELLDAIDKEHPNVMVIVHLYTKYSKSCANLNRCLGEIAVDMKHLKFVTLDASVAGLSENFKENGVPALLAYKKGELVKSLVQLEEFLDKDFGPEEVQELLAENGMMT